MSLETKSAVVFVLVLQYPVMKVNILLNARFYKGGLPKGTNVLSSTCTTLPPATKLGQGYVFTGVCDSVHRGGSASVHAEISRNTAPAPAQSRPRWSIHPPPPGSRHPPGTEHVGKYGQRAGGTHPTGMQSCFTMRLH